VAKASLAANIGRQVSRSRRQRTRTPARSWPPTPYFRAREVWRRSDGESGKRSADCVFADRNEVRALGRGLRDGSWHLQVGTVERCSSGFENGHEPAGAPRCLIHTPYSLAIARYVPFGRSSRSGPAGWVHAGLGRLFLDFPQAGGRWNDGASPFLPARVPAVPAVHVSSATAPTAGRRRGRYAFGGAAASPRCTAIRTGASRCTARTANQMPSPLAQGGRYFKESRSRAVAATVCLRRPLNILEKREHQSVRR
jgi:hypothetical protein